MKQKLYPSSRLAKLYKKELLKVVFKEIIWKHIPCVICLSKNNMNSNNNNKSFQKTHYG